MEKETGRRSLPPEAGPYPWMFFKHGKGYKNHAFYDISKPGKTVQKRIPELYNKKFQASCQGWFLTVSEKNECSLWNPVSLGTIQLPSVPLKSKQKLGHCIVTAPPGNPDSLVILFVEVVPLLMFCPVGGQHWIQQWYNKEIATIGECPEQDFDYFSRAVCCNGKLYAMTLVTGRLAVIERINSDRLLINSLQIGVPAPQETTERIRRYLVESSSELFVIYLIFGGLAYKEVIAVEVSRLDFSRMEWNNVKSAKDRVFFVDDESAICCPAVHEPGVHGNRVYFTLLGDKSMYSYNMEDRSVSVSLPCPNLPTPWCSPIWLMPDFRLSGLIEKREELKPEIQDTVKYVTSDKQEVEGYFGVLDSGVLSLIASNFLFYDYMSFRAVNKNCRLAAPPLRWETTLKRLDSGSLTPWLMVPYNCDRICNFIDPLRGERYLMNMPSMPKGDIIYSSKNGWCVMLGKNEIFLWNPFEKKTIPLPNMPQDCYLVRGCSLLSSPNSPGCAVILVSDYCSRYTCIDYLDLDKGQWSTYFAFDDQDFKQTLNNNPVPYKGSFYFLDSEGKLGVFEEVEDEEQLAGEVFDKPEKPCNSFKQSYLLECNGKLLSVFVGFMGKRVQVFELNFSSMSWMACENLGNFSLFVSRLSSFAIEARNGMENKVFFPRFCGNSLVYYSLDSGKYHCYGRDDVMVDFYGTKEQLLCSWIVPKWFID